MSLETLVWFAVLGAIGAGLIVGGWGRVAALAFIGGYIGAWLALSLAAPWLEEPEDQLEPFLLGFFVGMIAGAGFGKLVNWLMTELGGHVSPRSRTVIRALTVIAAAGVVVFLGEHWHVVNLVS